MKRLVAVLAVVGLIAAANATVIYTQTVTGDAGGKMTIEVDYQGYWTSTAIKSKPAVDRYNIYFTGEGNTASTTWLAAIDFAITGQIFQIWKYGSYDPANDIYNADVYTADGDGAIALSNTKPTSTKSFRQFDSHFMQTSDVRTDKTAPKEDLLTGGIYTYNYPGQLVGDTAEGYGTFMGAVYGITTAAQTNKLLVAQVELQANTTATFSGGTYNQITSVPVYIGDDPETGEPMYDYVEGEGLTTSSVVTAGQVSDASGEKFNVSGIVIQNTAPAPTGSNAKLWVGGTEPTGSGQGSSLTQNFGRVMQGTATSTSVTLNKSGTDSNTTNASVTLAGDATSTNAPTIVNFGTVSTVNAGISTSTLGDRTGTVTLDNQATNSAGTSQGSDNGNAVITVNATVLANRTFNGGTAAFGNVLKGATLSQIVSVTSTGAHNMYTDTTIAATSNTTNGLIAEGTTTVFNGTTTSGNWTVHGTTTTYGSLTGSNLTLLPTQGEVGVTGTQAPNSAQIPLTGNVGLAAAAASGTNNLSSFVSGNALYAAVANAGAYDGLASKTTAGGNVVGTEAIILDGNNTSGVLQNVAMNWRDRATVEKAGGTSPPLYRADLPLASDVVKVSGMAIAGGQTDGTRVETTMYVLQMSYNESLLGYTEAWMMGPDGPGIALMWLNEDYDGVAGASANDRWQNAVSGNFGGGTGWSPAYYFQRAYNPTTDFVLGRYGVDTTNNVVWAVINFNGQFAVPEPATMGLLALGGLMVLARKRRS